MTAKKKPPAGKTAKPPVVMIHGAFVAPWSLDGFAKKFRAAGYEVHVPCLRHHDKPKPPPELGQTSLTDYAADLGNFLDGLDGSCILVGQSMGGLLAQMLAARRDDIHSAILLAPSAPSMKRARTVRCSPDATFSISAVTPSSRVVKDTSFQPNIISACGRLSAIARKVFSRTIWEMVAGTSGVGQSA